MSGLGLKTVHLFFNGDGVHFPAQNAWDRFQRLQDARMFNVCAESWERRGWQVKRLSTADGGFVPIALTGRCAPTNPLAAWYPAPFWQFLAKAAAVVENTGDHWHAFATIDMLNHGLTPERATLALETSGAVDYASFQAEHLSFAGFAASWHWLIQAIGILELYDRGELADLGREVCDEYILRAFTNNPVCLPFATMANNLQAPDFPLVHHGRSTLRLKYESIPLS